MDVSCFPHFYTGKLKEFIKGSLLENEITSHFKLIKKEYDVLKERLIEINSTFEEYLKIRLILGARLFETSSRETKVKN